MFSFSKKIYVCQKMAFNVYRVRYTKQHVTPYVKLCTRISLYKPINPRFLATAS